MHTNVVTGELMFSSSDLINHDQCQLRTALSRATTLGLAESIPSSIDGMEKVIMARGRELAPLVAAQPGIAEICDKDAVIGLYQRRNKRAGLAGWMLLFYALWHNKHVLGRDAEGSVFECLG